MSHFFCCSLPRVFSCFSFFGRCSHVYFRLPPLPQTVDRRLELRGHWFVAYWVHAALVHMLVCSSVLHAREPAYRLLPSLSPSCPPSLSLSFFFFRHRHCRPHKTAMRLCPAAAAARRRAPSPHPGLPCPTWGGGGGGLAFIVLASSAG